MPLTELQIRGVLLDLVLMHSTVCHQAAFEQVFDQAGINGFQYPRYAGWRTRDVVEDVLRRGGSSASFQDIAEISSKKSRLCGEQISSHTPSGPRLRFGFAGIGSAVSPGFDQLRLASQRRDVFSMDRLQKPLSTFGYFRASLNSYPPRKPGTHCQA